MGLIDVVHKGLLELVLVELIGQIRDIIFDEFLLVIAEIDVLGLAMEMIAFIGGGKLFVESVLFFFLDVFFVEIIVIHQVFLIRDV